MPNELPLDLLPRRTPPVPIVALDVGSASEALDLVRALPDADFFKIGLQLYTAEGPAVVRVIKELGHRVFLDLKLHDIPNTVAGAVRAAADLGVDLLTVHASGGAPMLRAASEARAGIPDAPQLLAVTVLTSLTATDLGVAWGRAEPDPAGEAARLAALADEAGIYGVVTSVHEVEAIRARTRLDLPVLTPGIRLSGDSAGDQVRIATPEQAARLGVDYVVLGRTVTAAVDPAAAFARASAALSNPAGSSSRP